MLFSHIGVGRILILKKIMETSGTLCCEMTPCSFLFGALSHSYIPLRFEEMIFPLVSIIFMNHSDYIAFTLL